MLRNDLDLEEGMDKITMVFKALSDGLWHPMDDLAAETMLEKDTMLKIINFFRDYEFIEISVGGEAAKLDRDYIML
jgi:hypothetical protein